MTAETAREARCLLRAARSATLATSEAGQPHASLVTPACTPDLGLLILVSGLSPHTRHLRADPRCGLLAVGPAPEPNPQTAPRIGVTGLARPEPDPAMKQRWLAAHPYAAFYAGLGDFALWRIDIAAGQFIGGFARAARLDGATLLPDPGAVARIAAAEASILDHCNRDHADALALIAGDGPGWRMTACDVDGFDLARDDTVRRLAWSAAVADAGAVRAELVRMTHAAREALRGGPNPA